MSGFEVAGIVLGSLPLAISALEHYSDGLSKIQKMMRYEKVFRELRVIFEAAWTTYRACCERLLLPLAITDAEFKDLIDNPTSQKWNDDILRQKLKVRLGPAYFPFRNTTSELHKKVDKLRRKLKLDDNFLPPWIMKVGKNLIVDDVERVKFFKSKWVRIKGGIDSEGCTKLVDFIMRDIDLISAIVKDSVELEAPRRKRQQQSNSTYWITVRDHAKMLFQSFEARWSQPCRCQHYHRANLQLDVRKPCDEEIAPVVRFKFILSFDKKNSAMPPWQWRQVEVEPYCLPRSSSISASPNSSVPVVRFSPFTSSLGTPTSHPSMTPSVTRPNFGGPKITDFCHVLKTQSQSLTALGYLDDTPWQHRIYGLESCQDSKIVRNYISLDEIIRNKASRGDISTKEKRALALKLALAVLQLHNTPWLDATWATKDIYFFTDCVGPSLSLFEPPYVSRTFSAVNPNVIPPSTKSNGRILAKNPLLFALGVALIEISYGEPLLNRALPAELDAQGNQTQDTEMLVAARLVKDIRNRELDNYAWATARCVKCDMDYPFDDSLEDDGFRAKFIEGVISPLKDDYDEIFDRE